VHAHPRGLRRRAERLGDAVVGEVVLDPQPDRLALPVGQLGERLVEPVEPALLGVGGGARKLEPESRARAALERAPADGGEQDVARDREQPRCGGAAGQIAEPRAREPRLGERLGGEVVRGVRVRRARW